MVEIKETKAYEVAGELFFSKSDAQKRAAEIELDELCSKIGFGRGGEWDDSMIKNALKKNAQKLGELLSTIGAAS